MSSLIDLTREPDVAVRLRPGYALGTSADGATFELATWGQPLALGRAVPAYLPAFDLLVEGAPLDVLRDAVMAGAGAHAGAGFLVWMQRLARLGVLDYPLVCAGRCVATILPQRGDVIPALAPAGAAHARPLSRFAFMRRANGAWLIEHPLVGARLELGDPSLATALGDGRADGAPALLWRALAGMGFLEDGAEAADDDRSRTLDQWEFHDLAFHIHSRRGWHFDPVGGIFPHIDRIDPLPAVRPSWPGERIPLERARIGANDSSPFAEIVGRRRSHRAYDPNRPVTLSQLGAFLDRVAAVRATQTIEVANFDGRSTAMDISSRPYPTGGASYELEIYPVIERCEGLAPGLYHYDAGAHELVLVAPKSDVTDRMIADARLATAGQAEPDILFAIAARFSRVMWKYKSIAYAVTLRNAGVLYQAMYLTATDMGLSPCGVGSGDSALFARATGLDPVVEGTVGEFLLGGAPAPAVAS